jgi:hypothetical protein
MRLLQSLSKRHYRLCQRLNRRKNPQLQPLKRLRQKLQKQMTLVTARWLI